MTGKDPQYNFAYLDEQTKRMVRRALLKAVAVPGYQAPFASREMPLPYGWGTGGIQVTASVLTEADTLKVIDQGSDDTTNAVSIRRFFVRTAGVVTTTETDKATVIQTRHRIPETPLREGQVLVYQVPIPEPLRFMEPRETETRTMHALQEYGVMHVKLYEDVAKHGRIATSYNYPVLVGGRYVMSPSPIPRFDNPKMHRNPALQLFGAGREQRVYAVPPYTEVVSLDFEDHPFSVDRWDEPCALCGATDSYLDEIVLGDGGERMFVCSDTDYCAARQRERECGREAPWAGRSDPSLSGPVSGGVDGLPGEGFSPANRERTAGQGEGAARPEALGRKGRDPTPANGERAVGTSGQGEDTARPEAFDRQGGDPAPANGQRTAGAAGSDNPGHDGLVATDARAEASPARPENREPRSQAARRTVAKSAPGADGEAA